VLSAIWETWAWFVRQAPTQLYYGTSALQEAVAALPNLRRGPRPPWGFSQSFAQFIPWKMATAIAATPRFQKVPFQVVDRHDRCDPGSEEMVDTAFLCFSPSLEDAALPIDAPIVLLFPGLACSMVDLPGVHTIEHARSRGYRACVLDRRGHGQPLQAPRFQVFGCVDEVDQGIAELRRLAPNAPLFIYGVSSGSALIPMVLARRPDLKGGVCCLPGYDTALGGCLTKTRPPYDQLMLYSCRSHFLVPNEKILREFDAEAYDKGMAAKTVDEFMTAVVTFMGYKTREAYDSRQNPCLYMDQVQAPCLILNTRDDPICAIGMVTQEYRFGSLGRHCDIISNSKYIVLAVARSGSHCPFLDGWWPFQLGKSGLRLRNWGDVVSWDFFDLISNVQSVLEG